MGGCSSRTRSSRRPEDRGGVARREPSGHRETIIRRRWLQHLGRRRGVRRGPPEDEGHDGLGASMGPWQPAHRLRRRQGAWGVTKPVRVNADGPPSIDRLVEKPAELLPAGWTADARIFAWVNSEGPGNSPAFSSARRARRQMRTHGRFVLAQPGRTPPSTRECRPTEQESPTPPARRADRSVRRHISDACRPPRAGLSWGRLRYPRWRGDSREF